MDTDDLRGQDPMPAWRSAAGAGSRDPALLATLCERYYQQVQERVHRLLARDLRRGRPWLSAMFSTGDVVHEVFLGVVRDFDGFRGQSEQSFVAYLARLVRNRLVDSVRHHEAAVRDRRRTVSDAEAVVDPQATPCSASSQVDDAHLVRRILATLPARDRALLRGRLEDEASFAMLARALGYASADSARKAFAAAQAKLMTRLLIAREGRS